jgi:hypothetical protein
MSLLNLFGRKTTTSAVKVLQASATLYPDKILIETIDRVKEGFGISSLNLALLPIDASSELIGSKLKYHLSLTQHNLNIPKDYKKHYNSFLGAAGFKNAKQHHKDALHLTIDQRDENITIHPTRNAGATGKDSGFLGIKGTEIKLNSDISNQQLGNAIRAAWLKCECKCV